MPPVTEQTEDHLDVDMSDNDAPAVVEDVKIPIQVNGVTDDSLYQVTGKQGAAKGKLSLLFKPDMSKPNPFLNIIKMVSVENWVKIIYEDIIKPACKHATKACTDENGRFVISRFGEEFVKYFVSESRGGSKVRELQKRFRTVSDAITPYITAQLNPDEAQHWTDEEMAHWRTLMLEWADLSAKLSDAPEKGKKTKGKKAVLPVAQAA